MRLSRGLMLAVTVLSLGGAAAVVARNVDLSDPPTDLTSGLLSTDESTFADQRLADLLGMRELNIGQGGSGCAVSEVAFENPALGYSLCHPAGWSFIDLESAAPLTAIPVRDLYYLRLVSPALLPWSPGSSLADAVSSRGGFGFELFWDVADPSDCTLKGAGRVAGMPAVSCDYRFDSTPQYSQGPNGRLFSYRFAVPFGSSPTPPNPDSNMNGARLIVAGIARATDVAEARKVFERLIESLSFPE